MAVSQEPDRTSAVQVPVPEAEKRTKVVVVGLGMVGIAFM